MKVKSAAILCVVLAIAIAQCARATVYVVVGGSGGGTSWADAFGSVQDGIDAAFLTADQVWVAKGTYVERITLKADVAVYGGFVGTETLLGERPAFPRPIPDPDASILDGSAGGSVVTAPAGLTSTARLDGFTLTNGKNDFGGGGILCQSSSPTIINNTITENEATRGAGIYCLTASPSITDNVITDNDADDYGGGICCETGASPIISGNTITGNTAGYYGGGVDAEFDSSPTISGNTISDNNAGNDGGGIFCFVNSHPNIEQNTIEGNHASWHGGGIYCYQSSPTIFRNRITDNDANFNGGGIYCYDASAPTATDNIIDLNTAGRYGGGICCYWNSSPILTNNTIVSNTALYNGAGIDLLINCDASISNNIVAFNSSGIAVYASAPALRNNDVYNPAGTNYDGLAPGVGDISSDPLFVNLGAGDYHLTAGSPCRDAGWNGAPALPAVDYDGNPRIQGGTVDIGAFEYPVPLAPPPSTVSEVKAMPDGADVRIDGVPVTATRVGFFYVEMADRTAGIRVNRQGHACTVGSRVNVIGRTTTDANGERCLDAGSVANGGTGTVRPLALNGCSIRGCGLDCTGLLVRIWGTVTSTDPAACSFDIQWGGRTVSIACPAGIILPPIGAFVSVTGACSCERRGSITIPLILARTPNDLVRLN